MRTRRVVVADDPNRQNPHADDRMLPHSDDGVLHIEHQITDLNAWLQTFAKFAPAREQAGVTAARVFQPDDDPKYIVVNLTFETAEAATNFRTFLREMVWKSPDTSPALVGQPRAVVLNEVPTG
jgi:hypothetical protein